MPFNGATASECWVASVDSLGGRSKGLFCDLLVSRLLQPVAVTTAGKIESLLHNSHTQWIFCPVPSPDGKYLAFRALTFDSNA